MVHTLETVAWVDIYGYWYNGLLPLPEEDSDSDSALDIYKEPEAQEAIGSFECWEEIVKFESQTNEEF